MQGVQSRQETRPRHGTRFAPKLRYSTALWSTQPRSFTEKVSVKAGPIQAIPRGPGVRFFAWNLEAVETAVQGQSE